MQIFNTPQRYGTVAQCLHWATALLVVAAWLLGTLGDELPRGAARYAGLFVHISAGLAVSIMVAMRLLWRLIDPPPPTESTPLGAWLDRAGRFAHLALYALLIVVPVVGIVTQFARGQPLPVFGLGAIASPWAADRAFAHSVKEVHELLSNLLLAVAAVHAAAALAHHWLLRDRTLSRMLPGATR
ncbi:MAG TPA: cytochrome b [Pseudolabrys sp.]|nr:cytochrome b [Pseudolabrys sp.]